MTWQSRLFTVCVLFKLLRSLSGLPRTPTLRILWGARNDGIFLHEELNFKDKVLWVRPCKIGKKKSIGATL